MAWLHPEAMAKRLEAEVDALPEPKLALSTDEKKKRAVELTAQIDKLERTEEALIEVALSQGLDVIRRSNASPAAVLRVVVKPKKAEQRDLVPAVMAGTFFPGKAWPGAE